MALISFDVLHDAVEWCADGRRECPTCSRQLQILDKRLSQNSRGSHSQNADSDRRLEYKVRWKGYGESTSAGTITVRPKDSEVGNSI